ncbi:thioredoxin domain-containing protein [Lysinibacillus sp. SGAir0095]|uniref:DsbA family protein n=1 Tax=Lysinibacillus sp. SGAir0095 TaxID=2070463 RepID=UPI0010CD6511|nr:thioredoxin domain-containing protein [Lysinibacillus sp. SGAir0095]QCR33691.1 thiol-disulfide oxidoreductase [Lysinibacillus sp. SGAir0095]
MSKKIFWIVGIIAVCIIGIILLTDVSQETAEIDYENQPFMGDENAPVEIIEFGDYKCPHCGEFNSSMVPYIKEEFIDTGKAKFYFMNYSFIAVDSTTAALFAETVYQELGNEVFWEFHDLLFANQTTADGKENFMDETFLKAVLSKVASEEEVEQVVQAFSDNQGDASLDKDMEMANNLGVNSTPTIFIGGKKFEGMTTDDFAEMVEEASNDQ